MCPKFARMASRARFYNASQTITNSAAQIAPADPTRFAVLMRSHNVSYAQYAFGMAFNGDYAIVCPPITQQLVLTYDQIGALIQQPMYGSVSAGALQPYYVTFISAHPDDWERFING